MNESIWFLKRCDLFERLTPSEGERFERHALIRTFKRGSTIYFPTKPGQSVLVIARGRVKIKDVTPDGKETILAFIEEGEIFGELALPDSKPRKEYAEAVEESEVLLLAREDLLWLIEQRPDLAMHITKLVGFRRRRIENRLRNILFHSCRERIIHLLWELMSTHGQRLVNRWVIGLRLSHQELASLVGTTRETVTVVLDHLQRKGLVQIHRRRVTVLDPARLGAEVNRVAPDSAVAG